MDETIEVFKVNVSTMGGMRGLDLLSSMVNTSQIMKKNKADISYFLPRIKVLIDYLDSVGMCISGYRTILDQLEAK
jgi:hypothetical protein